MQSVFAHFNAVLLAAFFLNLEGSANLYAAASQEAYITRFSWQPGAIAFWDNRATWHFAQNDYQGQARMMHRVTIEGCELAAG